jgi:hypothetical protein
MKTVFTNGIAVLITKHISSTLEMIALIEADAAVLETDGNLTVINAFPSFKNRVDGLTACKR